MSPSDKVVECMTPSTSSLTQRQSDFCGMQEWAKEANGEDLSGKQIWQPLSARQQCTCRFEAGKSQARLAVWN